MDNTVNNDEGHCGCKVIVNYATSDFVMDRSACGVQSIRTQLWHEKQQTAEVETWLRSADREREKFQKQAFELTRQLEEKEREIAQLSYHMRTIALRIREFEGMEIDFRAAKALTAILERIDALTPPERKEQG